MMFMPRIRSIKTPILHSDIHTPAARYRLPSSRARSARARRYSTKIFRSVDEALGYFEAQGMFGQKNLFGN